MRRLRIAALAVASASAAAVVAHAGFTPAWSYLSPALRTHLAAQAGGSLFLPARTPSGYRYRSGAAVVAGKLQVPFTRRVRVRQGVYRWTNDVFVWRTERFAGACTAWAPVDKTLQLSGNKVYWSAARGAAWRCATDRRGRRIVLSASGARTLTDVPLATAVASGLDVSRRTSSATVSLAATPTIVRRGGSVLVHGVAGGCTAGDAVTVLSKAFSAAHSFAGVPAVVARVGSAGRFSVRTRIPSTRAPGRYGLTARCGGGNLGVTASLTVAA